MEEFSKQESFLFTTLVFAIIIVSVALLFFVLISKAPEPYTELYFLPNSLPEKAFAGDSVSVKFFAENHEGREMNYTYSLLLNSSAIKNGAFAIENGAIKEISESIILPTAGAGQKISVELKNAQQETYSIFFWIDVGEK